MRDVKLGPLRLLTIQNDVKETLGDALEAVGATLVAAERRPRPFPLSIPVRVTADEGDCYELGNRLRRQVRALLENAEARMQGLWFEFAADPELSAWLLIGGGDLSYVNGGPGFADYLLDLTDCYRVGSRLTHRPARRLESYDRRLVTTPRDYRGRVFSTDFAAQGPLVINYLPVEVSDMVGADDVPVKAVARRPLVAAPQDHYAALPAPVGRPHGDVIHYEQAAARDGDADVLVYDRQGIAPAYPVAVPYEVYDDFSVDTEALYTFDAGAGGNVAVAGGEMTPVANFNTENRLVRAQFEYENGQAASITAKVGASVANLKAGVILARQAAGTYVEVALTDDGGQSVITITPFVDGVLAGPPESFGLFPAPRLTAGQIFTLGAVMGADGRVEWIYRVQPDPLGIESAVSAGGRPFSPPAGPRTGAGGIVWKPGDAAARLDDFRFHALDPDEYGWERVLGPNQALLETVNFNGSRDLPLLTNGLCRVRWAGGTSQGGSGATPFQGFALDAYVRGHGWVETGRFGFRVEADAQPSSALQTLVSAQVVEWTPERAVLKVVVANQGIVYTLPGDPTRAEAYITLQRGWSGPQVDLYTSGGNQAGKPGAEVRWYPVDAAAVALATSNKVVFSDDPGFAWPDLNGTAWGAAENWLRVTPVAGLGLSTLIATLQGTGVVLTRADETRAYATSRKAIGIKSALAGAAAGSVSVRFGAGVRGASFEAEAFINAGGTRSQVADANASGGQAVQDTQAGAAAATLSLTAAQVNALPIYAGKYGLWVRVRNTTAAANVSVQGGFTGSIVGPVVAAAPNAYTWVLVGETTRLDNTQLLTVTAWRSAGAGNSVIDRVALVPLERRDISTGNISRSLYDGGRDHGSAALHDARSIPALVAR